MSLTAKDLVQMQRHAFLSGGTRSLAWRLDMLDRLESLIKENIDEICEASFKDLGKCYTEALMSEVGLVVDEIKMFKRKLRCWMRPKCTRTPWILWPAMSQVVSEPRGVVLIIGPWNYPFQLTMLPLVGALGSGNCVVIKPSEISSHNSALIEKLVAKYFPQESVATYTGGVPQTTELLDQHFDYIFFTGSVGTGKVIATAAAKNLTAVTLELGGKSPAIVSSKADVEVAAKRIAWGKFLNSGQTCVAPDFVYVHKSLHAEFLERLKSHVIGLYGNKPKDSKDYGRIINRNHFGRLKNLLSKSEVYFGGQSDESSLFIEPTVLHNVSWSSAIMEDEIFGPLLPVMTFENLDEILKILAVKPKPLAAYLFSNSKDEVKAWMNGFSFGGGCINDVVIHLANPFLSFGGVGSSGLGSYHGHSSFLTFSHQKNILRKLLVFDTSIRYPPFTSFKTKVFEWIFGVRSRS